MAAQPISATLSELAIRFGCELHGPADQVVTAVGSLERAGPDTVSFFANPLYRQQLAGTRAAAVIIEEQYRAKSPVATLVAPNPYAVYARIAAYLHPQPAARPGIHSTAVVADDAEVAASAQIDAYVVIGARSRIADSVTVGAGSVIGADTVIGAASRIEPRVVIGDRVVVGERCVILPGAVIGSDGFGFAREEARWLKVPQLGSVSIGNDVEIGANTTIDRGTIENTVIEDGVKLDNLIQIAHNVRIGAHTAMAGMCGVAGSTRIGKRCMVGGAAGIIGHLEICDDVFITYRSNVSRSIREPGVYSSALPADEAGRWRRNASRFKRLDSMAQRLKALERRLAENETSEGDEPDR